MNFKIVNWSEISRKYNEASLFLGNGASIAISDKFDYKSLLAEAKRNGDIEDQMSKLFGFFKTSDFELVLRLVWQASKVNESLGILDDETNKAYIAIRESLIKAVQKIHPDYGEVSHHFPKMHSFVKQFRKVFSLNYDLIVYWLMMHGLKEDRDHGYKDCFIAGGLFNSDWRRLRDPIRGKTSTTLVFYPHGNLALAKNLVGGDRKILTRESDDLLGAIVESWRDGEVTPLFVSEGTAEQKIDSILQSRYLTEVANDVYSDIGSSMVIYGWGLGEQDQYILKAIESYALAPRRFAISIYKENQEECERFFRIVTKTFGSKAEIDFFHSDSPGCWIN